MDVALHRDLGAILEWTEIRDGIEKTD